MRFLSFIMVYFCAANFLMAQNIHAIYPKPGQTATIKSLFNKVGVADTNAIVVLLPPMSCPRCEGLINVIFTKIRALSPSIPSTLIAFYDRKDACLKYLAKRNFLSKSEVVLSSDDSLLNVFSYAAGSLQVPVFLRVNAKEGVVLNQLPCLGVTINDETVSNFLTHQDLAYDKTLNVLTDDVPISEEKPLTLKWTWENGAADLFQHMVIFEEERLINDQSKSISKFIGSNISQNKLAAIDDLSLSLMLLVLEKDGKGYQIERIFDPNKLNENPFISADVPDSIVLLLKKMNLLNGMYFAPQIVNDSMLMFTGSLPKVFWENKKNEDLAYANELVIGKFNLNTKKLSFSKIKHQDTIGVAHTKAYFVEHTDYVIFPIKRGWPTTGNSQNPDADNPLLNPFLDSFYHFTPAFAVFDNSGNFIKYLGTLPTALKTLRTGYALNDLEFSTDDGKLYVADRLSGTVNAYSIKSLEPVTTYNLGLNKGLLEKQTNNRCNSLNDIVKLKSSISEEMEDFVVQNDTLYLIVKQGKYDYLKKFDLKQFELKEELFLPRNFNENQLNEFRFAKKNNRLFIYSIVLTDNSEVMYLTKIN